MKLQTKTVFVGLSGGVDSSVAALRLKNEGYNVVGVFIKVWHPDFLECDWEAERLDAMRVAAHLEIPFLTCDAEEAYKTGVADYFIETYKAGKTPNPDVLCNQQVKFGAFMDFALAQGADYIATGHYAQNIQEDDVCVLKRGVDGNKDQTYFLWTLTQAQLKHVLLPVGDAGKDTIRKEAEDAGIPVAQKADSQGVCFLGHINIPEFLSHFIDLQPGQVLDESGAVIGEHKGALVYTMGQRHGFILSTQTEHQAPRYVVGRDIERNTITVSTERATQEAREQNVEIENVHWITQVPEAGTSISFQTRYRQTAVPGILQSYDATANTASISPITSIETPAAGQSCVLYADEQCLGGGIIL